MISDKEQRVACTSSVAHRGRNLPSTTASSLPPASAVTHHPALCIPPLNRFMVARNSWIARAPDQFVRGGVWRRSYLSVRTYLRNHTSKCHPISCVSCLWARLGPPLATLQYVQYFRFLDDVIFSITGPLWQHNGTTEGTLWSCAPLLLGIVCVRTRCLRC